MTCIRVGYHEELKDTLPLHNRKEQLVNREEKILQVTLEDKRRLFKSYLLYDWRHVIIRVHF